MNDLPAWLEARQQEGLYRHRRVRAGPQDAEMVLDGQRYLAFCSNDYLGLGNHPLVVRALQDGAQRHGAGSGASHLISGHQRVHHQLEEELAEFTGRPRALLFSTGYMANLGAVTALAGRGDTVMEDRLNHASLVDAGLLSSARLRRYAHADTAALEQELCACREGTALIVSDGVFSMDGDIAPLVDLAALAQRHHARLMIDDAHGIGVLGANGGGTLEHQSAGAAGVAVLVGTLGKALGTFGAFVAGEDSLIETLIQRARTYIYTTALPPAVAEATRTSLRLARQEGWRRERLNSLIARFRQGARQLGLPLLDSHTPIQPLHAGQADVAVRMSEGLLARGIFISAIRPPTVPRGHARLRITFSALHTETHIDRLLDTLGEICREMPIPDVPPR